MTYDYIIVGAGSAGCVLANRLSANPAHRVLLLEAGAKDSKMEIHIPAAYGKLHRSSVDWAYYTEPQKYLKERKLFHPRGKTLGGSSSTNAMAYIRGNSRDYDDWEALGNKGWSYKDVLPYFIKSECNEQYNEMDAGFHGKNGLLNVTKAQQFKTPLADTFVKACVESGIPANNDFNGKNQEGTGLFQFTIKNAKRHSTATAFLDPAKKRENLEIITNVLVKQIIIQQDTVRGIEFYTSRTSTQKVYGKNVIMTAGAFNTPQILMLSGIGNREELKKLSIETKKNLVGVGKNLQDHLFFGVGSLCKQPITANTFLKPFNQLKGAFEYFLLKKGPFTMSPLEANAFSRTDPKSDRVNIQFHFAPVHIGEDLKTDLYDLKTYPLTDGYSILPTLIKPKSRGTIALRTAGAWDAPSIDPQYFSEQDDLDVMLKAFRMAYNIGMQSAFEPYRLRMHPPKDTASDGEIIEHIINHVETVYHPVGTCKMGDDEMSVVDSDLKVKGIDGLWVADASVMPTIPSGNTNAAVIMIAEKFADMILGKK
jgi:choline dehydrogenase